MTPEQPTNSMIPSEEIKDKIAKPQVFDAAERDYTPTKIIVHNDEVTPYDYVIHILGDLFMLSEELADHIAWTAHTKGVAVVVVRGRTEAEKLVRVAHGRARQANYPLTFSLEQE